MRGSSLHAGVAFAMWFKNLQVYQLDQEWTLPAAELEEKLALRPLQPCSAMASESRGWVSPRDDEQLVHGLERHLLIALGSEQKLLPSSVINDAVKQRAREFEQLKGFRPGRKAMRDIKDQVTVELLPRAFSRRRTTRAWIDPSARRIVVDSASPTRAEELVEALRDALGELAVSLLQTQLSPGQKLTEWLSARSAPGRFELGEECELTGTDAARCVVRYLRHPLDAAQIRKHLEEGLKASRLALSWSGRLSLVVNDKLQIKRLRFMDMEEADEAPTAEDPERRFEAEFLLMTGQCGPMLSELETALGRSA